MAEVQIYVELTKEDGSDLDTSDKFEIEDAVQDALSLDYTVGKLRVRFVG